MKLVIKYRLYVELIHSKYKSLVGRKLRYLNIQIIYKIGNKCKIDEN